MDVNAMLGVGGDVGYGGCVGLSGGVRVDVVEELKFLRKFKKNFGVGGWLGGGGQVGGGEGVGLVRGGVRVDVNAMLGRV